MAERAMTCADASPLLDAFVDAELQGATLIDLARHAAACSDCDGALRELIAVHEVVARRGSAEAEALDLSGLWPALAPRLEQADARRAWRRRLRSAPVWGALAVAASALIWFRAPQQAPSQVATRARPNQAIIERIDSDGGRFFELRRERKNGTTLIMVSATAADGVP